jgi:hypothetical protein
MRTRRRIAITAAVALLLGAETYARSFDLDLPGLLADVWYGPSGLFVYGLSILGVALVYRWWALLPALAPLAVGVYLRELTDYTYPWHEDLYASPLENPAGFLFLAALGVGYNAAWLSLGLLLRAVWEAVAGRFRRESSLGSS